MRKSTIIISLLALALNAWGQMSYVLYQVETNNLSLKALKHDIEADGVSPTEIFGLEKEQMEPLLTGLSINYPEFINASFTHDLDNITLRSSKTSKDVLSELF